MDWNRARAFLTTAEAGSLSAAAKQLGLTQPTLSRQVAALEAELGVTLFERVGKKLVLTETGASLVEHAKLMGDGASAMAFAASGRSKEIGGRVTLSVTDSYAAYILPDIVARLGREAPQIRLVIIAANTLSDLRRREADIAVRHVRPQEDGLIGRQIGESAAHFYAAPDWIARHGHPASVGDIPPDQFIGFDETEDFLRQIRGIGVRLPDAGLRLVSKNAVVVWEMVRRGLGVCLMSREVGRRAPGLVDLFPDFPAPRFPIWLVTHRELRTSPRIRYVFELLGDELAKL